MRTLVLTSVSVALFGLFNSPAFGQVFYEPASHQYGTRVKFYYGGSDPHVIARANGYDRTRRPYITDARHPDAFGEPVTPPLRVYHDSFPYQNAALYGYTANDALNQANASVPCYFRKSDLLKAAAQQPDGSLKVPAWAGSIFPAPVAREQPAVR